MKRPIKIAIFVVLCAQLIIRMGTPVDQGSYLKDYAPMITPDEFIDDLGMTYSEAFDILLTNWEYGDEIENALASYIVIWIDTDPILENLIDIGKNAGTYMGNSEE